MLFPFLSEQIISLPEFGTKALDCKGIFFSLQPSQNSKESHSAFKILVTYLGEGDLPCVFDIPVCSCDAVCKTLVPKQQEIPSPWRSLAYSLVSNKVQSLYKRPPTTSSHVREADSAF